MKAIWERLTTRDRIALCVAALMLILYLNLISGRFLLFWVDGVRLAAHGKSTTGLVTWTGGQSQIRYSWTVNGTNFEAQDGTGHRKFTTRDSIALRYLPESPSVAHFDWEKLKWRGEVGFPISLTIWLLICFLLVRRLRRISAANGT